MGKQHHPLTGMRAWAWWKLCLTHGPIGMRYWWRAMKIGLLGLGGLGFRAWETMRWAGRLRRMKIEKDPVFILGHWRSGTTLLHNLMACDDRYGTVRMHHYGVGTMLEWPRLTRKMVGAFTPEVRPMDQMGLGVDEPAEEELALGRVSEYSFDHAFCFPRRAREVFEKTIMFEGVGEKYVESWKWYYEHVLKKVTVEQDGRRLVLKSPGNTGRVATLLGMFKKAKFVHLVRDPYEVFASTRHLWRKVLPLWALQGYEELDVDGLVLDIYQRMMKRYFEDRKKIGEGRLCEVRYEALVERPIEVLEEIYVTLGLEDYEGVRERVEGYVAGLEGYERNRLALTKEEKERVREVWGFAFEAFGYEM